MKTVEEVEFEIWDAGTDADKKRMILRSYAEEIREECAKGCEQWKPDGEFYANAIRSLKIP